MNSNAELFALIDGLVDGWCERRSLSPLRILLPVYPMVSTLSDSWHELQAPWLRPAATPGLGTLEGDSWRSLLNGRSLGGRAKVSMDWIVDPRERPTRVVAGMAAILTLSWLALVTAGIRRARAEGGLFVLAAIVLVEASVTYSLARRAIVTRSQERRAKRWRGLSTPWDYCLSINGVWLIAFAPPARSPFFLLHVGILGASILLAIVGRRLDRSR
jgi:hypothetical protein